MTRTFLTSVALAALTLAACGDRAEPPAQTSQTPVSVEEASVPTAPETADPASSLTLVKVLAADDMNGRLTASEGGAKARAYLVEQLEARGLAVTQQAFTFENREGESVDGVNLISRIEGTSDSEQVLVVTAHYDHVGAREGEIYNGADDNASGVAGAFAVADHFLADTPDHDVAIVLLDAEEMGLQGAQALVRDGLPGGGEMAFNLNFDMLSKNDKNELYASGSYHNPQLLPLLDGVAANAPVSLKLGHDRPEQGPDDWTFQSDHGVFHRAGIAFIYFGVEDHPDYHQPSDVFDSIPQDFFLRSVETVVMAAEAIDAELGDVMVKPE